MKLKLTALNQKSQVIDQIQDMTFEDIGIDDIVIVRIEDTNKIVKANKVLAELSVMTGKVFVFIPGDVKFFRLQEEKESA